MKVIGISGLHRAIDFKKHMLPGLDSREYRVSQGFDAAAALIVDGRIRAAAAEERFTGAKATERFPINALRYCLARAGLAESEVDAVAHGFAYEPSPIDDEPYYRQRFAEVYQPAAQLAELSAHLPSQDWAGRFVSVPHHLAHAASAYYPSGFADALVLVADGMGETESLTVAVGSGGKLTPVHRIPALHSLGTLYGVFTLYLGFEMMLDEYKVMGLASFGDAKRYYDDVLSMVSLREGGSFAVPVLARDANLVERETHRGALRAIAEKLGPPRRPGDPLERRHIDIAAAVQAVLQTCLLHTLRHFRRETGIRDLCMAGGVALNCTANGIIQRSRLFDRVFVQPAAGDDGSALGAALYVHAGRQPETRLEPMDMPYWGPAYTEEEIGAACRARVDCRSEYQADFSVLAGQTAESLAVGQVVAWFQGGMEFGPRALGNRSILADPRDERMRDHINALVKRREDFRPFAPVVTQEAASELFEIKPGTERTYAHMLYTTRTRPEHRHRLGAVTHVDGTARVQVVGRDQNPRLWELLNAFGTRTGTPVLLNTSFNLRGQPIVASPQVAIDTMVRGGLDRLVIGCYTVLPPHRDGSSG